MSYQSFFDAVARHRTNLHTVPGELDRTLADFRRNTALAILEEILDDPGNPYHAELESIVELCWPGGAA